MSNNNNSPSNGSIFGASFAALSDNANGLWYADSNITTSNQIIRTTDSITDSLISLICNLGEKDISDFIRKLDESVFTPEDRLTLSLLSKKILRQVHFQDEDNLFLFANICEDMDSVLHLHKHDLAIGKFPSVRLMYEGKR